MNPVLISQMQQFCKWVRETKNLSANFQISFFEYSHSQTQETSYWLWIDKIHSVRATCLKSLVQSIPAMKAMCLQSKEA